MALLVFHFSVMILLEQAQLLSHDVLQQFDHTYWLPSTPVSDESVCIIKVCQMSMLLFEILSQK